jgi:hypothetical protein
VACLRSSDLALGQIEALRRMDRFQIVALFVGVLAATVVLEIAVLVGAYVRRGRPRRRSSDRAVLRRLNGSRFWFRRVLAVVDSERLEPAQRREAYSQVLIQRRIDERTAVSAAMGLAELEAPAAARLILHAVDDGRLPAFAGAAALAQAIPVVEAGLAALLVGGELGEKAKRVAVATLGERGGEPSVRALVVLLTMEQETTMRLAVTRALLGCVVRGGRLPRQVCPRLTTDPSPQIRAEAALLAAASMGDPAAHLLFPMLADVSGAVAQRAARAICDLPSGLGMVRRFLGAPANGLDAWDRARGFLIAEISLRAPQQAVITEPEAVDLALHA